MNFIRNRKLLMLGICCLLILVINSIYSSNTIATEQKTAEAPLIVNEAKTATPVAVKTATPSPKKKKAKKPQKEYLYSEGYIKVRKKSSKKSAQKFLLKPGQKVQVIKKGKKWTKIKIKKGTGYVLKQKLSKSKKTALKIANKKAKNFKLTGYCSCYSCSEGWGRQTKSGRNAKSNHTIATDLTVLPLYTEVYISGMGEYTVEDVGGGVRGNHIDVYCDYHSQCYNIKSSSKVYVIE